MRRFVVLLMLGACGTGHEAFDVTLDASPEASVAHDAAVVDGAPADATNDAAEVPWIVPPLATCTAQGSTCLGLPDPGIHASYRKDFFYPYARYPEASLPDPVDGGRVQIAATAKVSGAITQVFIDGQDADVALTTGAIDWWHAWPASPNAGDAVWVSFHSRLAKYDQAQSVPITVKTANGDAVSGAFPMERAKTPITYVTTTAKRDALLVFLQNRDTAPHSLAKLWVQGRDATQGSCIPKTALAPNESLLVTVPLCSPLSAGAAWTVVASFVDGSESVATGRAITTLYPIEYWPSGGECSVPGGNPATWKEIQSHGFDMVYPQYDWSKCPKALDTVSFLDNQLKPNDFYALLTDGNDFPLKYGESDHTPAILVSDEGDSSYGTPSDPQSGPKRLAALSKKLWKAMPSVATYTGGSRHRHTGAYAGVADIQGMDFYVAACAPHITDFGNAPPLRAAYDYAVATRENHMPNPTWIYAQGFGAGWNAKVLGLEVDRQPSAAEMRVQAYSVMAAGAKGLMWFQGTVAESTKNQRNQDTWADLSRVNHEFRAVRRYLQAGEPIGAEVVGKDAVAEAVRSTDAIVVPVFDVAAAASPSDLACATGQDAHFTLAPSSVTVRVTIPDDFGVLDVFELDPSGAATTITGTLKGRALELPMVTLDAARPTRLYVLARNANVRAAVTAAYQ